MGTQTKIQNVSHACVVSSKENIFLLLTYACIHQIQMYNYTNSQIHRCITVWEMESFENRGRQRICASLETQYVAFRSSSAHESLCITSSPVYNENTSAAGKENAGPRYVKRGNQSTIYNLLSEHFIQFFAYFHCRKNWLSPSLWIESSACAVSQGRKGLVGRIKVSIRNYVKEPACRSNVSIMMVGWGDKSSTLVLFDSTLGWDQAKGEQPPPSWYWVTSHWTTDEIGWFQNLLSFYVGQNLNLMWYQKT